MRILERYTLRSYLAPLAWCLIIFIGLYLILDLLGHLDEILRYRVPFSILVTYHVTMVPLIFVQVAPFACLMATLYTLGNLNRHLELIAMRASGIGPLRITGPLLVVGILMSVAVGVVNEVVAPEAALIANSIKATRLESPSDPKKPHRVLKTIQHLATYGLGHTLLYAKAFDPVEKRMEGIVILQHGADLSLKRKITAEAAVWTGSQWKFLDGTILQFNSRGETVGRPVPFKEKFIQAGDRPEILERSESQAAFMNMRDLGRYIQRLEGAGGSTIRKLKVDWYAKPAAALACLILTLIGIPTAIQPIRGGTALGLSLGLGVGLAFYGINALSLALGKGGWFPPWIAAWAAPLGFAWYGLRKSWEKLA
ncbi:MAG: LptF/LptG family permease [Candidatus Omnitrophica bacterium]|nr:LptF/LptG family permease [Candidatus Omnitrophota bacterium]